MTIHGTILAGGHPLPRDLSRSIQAARATQDAAESGMQDTESATQDTESATQDAESAALLSWAAELPRNIDRLAAQWGLEIGPPLEPGGTSAWVAEVRDASGADLLLKVGWAHEEARDEAAGLAAWQGRGAVRLDRHERVGDCSALLMERVRPGTTLASTLPEEDRDIVIATLLRSLWSAPVDEDARETFRPLSLMCAQWADAAAARLQDGREAALLPQEIQEQGLHLMRTLPLEGDGQDALLATDLHHHNVLSRRGHPGTDLTHWALIDPKPYIGDPHYDLLQHMLNFRERLVADPESLARRMAQLTGLDAQRTIAWLFARCVQETGTMDGARDVALALAGRVSP